jgi:tetratricopeptide (TPR) repeat protein
MAHKHIVYMMLVDAAVIERDEETIKKYASLLEDLAIRDEHQPYLAIAHRAHGIAHKLAGEYEKAEARLREALEIFESQGMVWQQGRTIYELGELTHQIDKLELSRELFDQAIQIFEDIKADPDVERSKAALVAIKPK